MHTSYVMDNLGATIKLDAVELTVDRISDDGNSALFGTTLVQVRETAAEVLTLVLPEIIFSMESPTALQRFSEALRAHLEVCEGVALPTTHISIDLTGALEKQNEEFAQWCPPTNRDPHGRDVGAYEHFEAFCVHIQSLPDSTVIWLHLSSVWRDYRSLRALSQRHGLYHRTLRFNYRVEKTNMKNFFPDFQWHLHQMMAAMKNIEIPDGMDLGADVRKQLVNHGCTGFNATPPST